MNKLSKEKRTQLIIAIAIVAVVLGGIYWGIILPQYASLQKVARVRQDKLDELKRRRIVMKSAVDTENAYEAMTNQLAVVEGDVGSGDYYTWVYDWLRRFKANYKVEIPDIGSPVATDVDMFPHFPLRQIRLSMSGKGYYHDLGKFLADLENTFPHVRVENLNIQSAGSDTDEKLSFQFDLVALVKPNS